MGVDAAKKADKENSGSTTRIKVAHRFVDLEVKGHAELLETLIAGPWITRRPLEDSDTIRVPPADYEREVKLEGTYWRVGVECRLSSGSPNQAVARPAGPGPRRSDVSRHLPCSTASYIGANYRGQIVV